jgi:molybdenum-dependent DNA-binding transcriptional regulator ModE
VPTLLDFRFGDVFDPDDELSLWFCTIALAFNDIVLTHVAADETDKEWERFYYTRIGIGHYNEALLYLERNRGRPAVRDFIASLSPDVREAYEQTLAKYDSNRAVANRLRNQAIFHYPNREGVEAMQRALRDPAVQEARGGVTSASGKVRDTRLHYADEVMAKMVMNACGGGEEETGAALDALAQAVQSFMRFANAAQDEFLVRKRTG